MEATEPSEETIGSSEELSEVFRNYRSALNSLSYVPTRFKTPLQRASAISKHHRALNLAQIRQFEREHISTLLPQGMHTRLRVDLFDLLASSTKSWKLRVPSTLLSQAGHLVLVRSNKAGKVRVKKNLSENSHLRVFMRSILKSRNRQDSRFPKFVHKCGSSHVAFLFDLYAAEEIWHSHVLENQRLQLFIVPPHPSVSLIRAHWKQSSKRAVYYVVHNSSEQSRALTSEDNSLHTVSRKSSVHMRFKSLADKFPSEEKRVQGDFFVNEKAANTVFVKRAKPEAEVDCMLQEVSMLVEATMLEQHEAVEELVCDFVLDWKGKPVLLACQGFTLTTHKVSMTRMMAPTYVSESHVSIITDEFDSPPLSSEHSPIKLSAMARSSTVKRLLPRLARPAAPIMDKPDFRFTQVRLTSVVSAYDAMVSKVKEYKEELKISINFIDKYGGVAFWKPILRKIGEVFRADEQLKRYYDHLNFEESEMLLRGYQRILEGNYNLYYKKSMTKVHTGKGINIEAFNLFVTNVGLALDGYPLMQEDILTIISRFRSFQACICPE